MSGYSDLEWAILEELLSQRDNRDGLIIDGDVVVGDRFVFAEGTIDIPALAAAVRRSLDQPPDGKLRVRVCVAVGSNDYWHAVGGYGWSDGHCRAEAMDPFDHDDDPVAIKWIEAFVDKYVPPAEETVQGREVDHG